LRLKIAEGIQLLTI